MTIKKQIIINDEIYLSLAEMTRRYKIASVSLVKWHKNKEIRGFKEGRNRFIHEQDVINRMKKVRRYLRTQKNKSWIVKTLKKDLFWTGKKFSKDLQKSKVFNTKSGGKKIISDLLKKEEYKKYKIIVKEVLVEN